MATNPGMKNKAAEPKPQPPKKAEAPKAKAPSAAGVGTSTSKAEGDAGVPDFDDAPAGGKSDFRKKLESGIKDAQASIIAALRPDVAGVTLKGMKKPEIREAVATAIAGHKLLKREEAQALDPKSAPAKLDRMLKDVLDADSRAISFSALNGLRSESEQALRVNFQANTLILDKGNFVPTSMNLEADAKYLLEGNGSTFKGLKGDKNYYYSIQKKEGVSDDVKLSARKNEDATKAIIDCIDTAVKADDKLTFNRLSTLLEARTAARFEMGEGKNLDMLRGTTPNELILALGATEKRIAQQSGNTYNAATGAALKTALDDFFIERPNAKNFAEGEEGARSAEFKAYYEALDARLKTPTVAVPAPFTAQNGNFVQADEQFLKTLYAISKQEPLPAEEVTALKGAIESAKNVIPAMPNKGERLDAEFSKLMAAGIKIERAEGASFDYAIKAPQVQAEVLRHMHALVGDNAQAATRSFEYFQSNPKAAHLVSEVVNALESGVPAE